MKKDNNQIKHAFIYALAILAILAIGLLTIPQGASAEGGSNTTYDTFTGFNNTYTPPQPPIYNPYPVYNAPPIYTPTPVYNPPIVYNPIITRPIVYSPVITQPVAPAPAPTTRIVYVTSPAPRQTVAVNPIAVNPIAFNPNPVYPVSNETPDLTANVSSANSFMPGILQWIIFAILAVIAIILIRRIFSAQH